jgi:HEAT repeat protein
LRKGSALRVTYVWDDPAGKERRNVTVAESLPYSYEIQAGGARWEDCVCRELLVESLPATGEGNRTVVKESPAAFSPLPPEPTVPDTRTRWFRPGEKGRPLALEECVKIVRARDLKRMRSALIWLTELADPSGFEAARFAVLDPEIAGTKGIKELALLALYNSDSTKSRPVLLEVAAGEEKSPWRSSPTDPAIAGGAWMGGVCIIGQMAAEAGWREFAPLLARACDSPHCNDQHRMSLMRSIASLTPVADAAVDDAVRQSLAMKYPYMLAEAARAAGALGDAAALPRLRELVTHDFLVVRAASLVALARLGDRDSIPAMKESLVRIPQAATLDHFKYGTEIWFCEDLRAAAAEALGILADPSALPALEAAEANEPVAWVRDVIKNAIAGTRGKVAAGN